MSPDPAGHITLYENPARVRVWAGNVLIADSCAAIELRESGYPARQYIPREDIAGERLRQSSTVTHCPFKGDATYYSLEVDGTVLPDVAWSYEQPFTAMAAIRERLAFDTHQLVEEKIENQIV